MKSKRALKNQKGFTLIEIIAVLVILGILAAVAIPKFLSLQDDAKKKNAEAGVAAGQSAISMGYAKYLLNGSTVVTGVPASPAAACGSVATSGAEAWGLTCTGTDWTGSTSSITATYGGQSAAGTWTKP